MEKTLDTLVLLHRLIMAVTLAIFIVAVSTHPAGLEYEGAKAELQTLEDAIQAAADQEKQAYKDVYEHSDLETSTLAWLKAHGSTQTKIGVEVGSSGDFSVPDANAQPTITLDQQVKWADHVFRQAYDPIFVCFADQKDLFHALDETFRGSAPSEIASITVYVRGPLGGLDHSSQFQCGIELHYKLQMGNMTVERSVALNTPTTTAIISRSESGSPSFEDLDIAGTLKASGLGDYEDSESLVLPALRHFWTDISSRSPADAEAYLSSRRLNEEEKAKERIEILGESLSPGLTIMMAAVVTLSLTVYLLIHLLQIRASMNGNEQMLSSSPFFGVMRASLGRTVMYLSVSFLPSVVCLITLVFAFPGIPQGGSKIDWITGLAARSIVEAAVAGFSIGCLYQMHRILEGIQTAATASNPPEDDPASG